MKQNDWTSKLHERLADQEATVPDGLWDKIATRLDDTNAAAQAELAQVLALGEPETVKAEK